MLPPAQILYAGPMTRAWSELWRLASAAILGIAAWVSSLALTLEAGEEPILWRVNLDALAGLVAVVLASFRHRSPFLIAAAVSLIVGFSSASLGAWLLVAISLASRRRVSEIVGVFGITLASGVAASAVDESSRAAPFDWSWAGILALVVAIPLVIGYARGARRAELDGLRREAELLREEQRQIAEQARLAERGRIAAEMHDALGHQLSVIAVQAAALKLHPELPAAQRQESVSAIRTAAQQALSELRHTLSMLAEDSPEPEPSPRLSERIDDLIEQVRQAGSPVQADLDQARLDELPAELGRPVFRIVQECLTNAMRHAPGVPVHLSVRSEPDTGVQIRVSNAFTTASEPSPGSGIGLAGIAERARLADGELQVLRSAEHFTVEARLPWLR